MPFIQCPSCKKITFIKRLSLRDKDFPFVSCPRCSYTHIPEYLAKRTEKEYAPPRKWQIPLCGLPAGIAGALLVVIGCLINNMFVSLLGGILLSFWILLIAMALSLWKEITRNSEQEYQLIISAKEGKKETT